jgi:hypothetical protein
MSKRRGYTPFLIVAGVLLAIFYVAVFWPRQIQPQPEDAYTKTVENSIQISMLCRQYYELTGRWPTSIGSLSYMILITNTNIVLDGWDRPFVFRVATNPATSFWIISYGADGVPGGKGSNTDSVMEVK